MNALENIYFLSSFLSGPFLVQYKEELKDNLKSRVIQDAYSSQM
jgi:hypothetical protein